MQRLCQVLNRLGANPVDVSLPNLPGHLKTGADDFIVFHGGGKKALKEILNLPRRARGTSGKPKLEAPPITADELSQARISPTCIVEDFLYADVGTLIAPGGVGKTTLVLHMAIHIVLGTRLFGRRVLRLGPVLILTAEDSREILVGRLRACMDALDLTEAQRGAVMSGVRIADVTGEFFKLTIIDRDTVRPSPEVDEVLELIDDLKPVMVYIDPAVSFGVGESRVNDAEQGLIEVGRKIREAAGCGVMFIQHTGKANAREKVTDQYAGRGGSAFADGSRMVHVMHLLDPSEWSKETGGEIVQDESQAIRYSMPKMTFCPPPGSIYIKRTGYRFEIVAALPKSKAERAEANAELIWSRFAAEVRQGHYPTKNSMWHTLKGEETKISRDAVWGTIDLLVSHGRLVSRPVPGVPGAGGHGAKTYLHPVGVGTEPLRFTEPVGKAGPEKGKNGTDRGAALPMRYTFSALPPYREITGGKADRRLFPLFSPLSRNPMGKRRESGKADPQRADPPARKLKY